jgi:ABC-type sugar transport systems, ATPase components
LPEIILGENMSDIVLENIRKRFGSTEVIKGVSMAIQSGEFIVFVGPSGCGKSTLLRLIAGLEEITDGILKIGGKIVNDTPPAERGLAMVFQSYALYPHMTAYENMAFGLRQGNFDRSLIDENVREAARILHIEELLDRKPKQLSGGQRQRVAIGRAIVRKPSVFLFDEPLSNLDAALRVKTRIEIANLHNKLGTTMIYVTHDQSEAMTLADRIVVLRSGLVEQIGSPLELYHRPINRFVAGFLGSPQMNFLPGTLRGRDSEGVTIELDGGVPIRAAVTADGVADGAKVELGVRPEHVELSEDESAMPSKVEYIEQLGDAQFVYLSLPGGNPATARVDSTVRLPLGVTVKVACPAIDCHVFLVEDGRSLPRLTTARTDVQPIAENIHA